MNIPQLFTHSVDGPAGCFLVWATANKSAIIKQLLSFGFLHIYAFLLGIYLWVELLGCNVDICLNLWKKNKKTKLPNGFPKQLNHFTCPSTLHGNFSFSTFLPIHNRADQASLLLYHLVSSVPLKLPLSYWTKGLYNFRRELRSLVF